MADVFSTVAGVASFIDVALRGCTVLYDSVRYLKDEPELSQRLRRTVQSVQSILHNLNEFVATYRQQQVSAGVINFLPDAVRRNGVRVHEDLSRGQDHLLRRYEDTALDLGQRLDSICTGLYSELDHVNQTCERSLPAQEHLNTGFENLRELISTGQNVASSKFDTIEALLSQTRVLESHVRSSTVLTAPTEDVLARVFRKELQRVIMPTVEQCFQKFKANPDSQLDEIRRTIDRMTQQLGSMSGGDWHDGVVPANSALQEVSNAPTHHHQGSTDHATVYNLESTAFGIPKCQNRSPNQHIRHSRFSWTFRWTIGTLWVTFSTTTINRKRSVYRVGEFPSPQKACRVTIDFLPAQSLVQLRGLTLSVANTQDQRGYSQICPLISTFAVVHWDSEVMTFACANNVEGLQNLFERRLAAPNDRDEYGRTPLMNAAHYGASEACRLLLSEGSDPLAVNEYGLNSFDFSNHGFLYSAHDGDLEDRHYEVVVELSQRAESDIFEDSPESPWLFRNFFSRAKNKETLEGPIISKTAYVERLKELGFKLGFPQVYSDHHFFSLVNSIDVIERGHVQLSRKFIREWLQTIAILGVKIHVTDSDGYNLLHWTFFIDWKARTEQSSHTLFELTTALLQEGVNPYALTNFNESVFNIAEENDLTSVFIKALEEAGYDPDEVRQETERRQWCFENPGHGFAESTAVDDAEIAPPSEEGLVLRRAVRGDRLED
ncbi:MAG: hypothetical protein Q9216_001593 [Gyalolechia sp. 2 TL-2023]